MSKTKTAVEWLIEQLEFSIQCDSIDEVRSLEKLYSKAKEIERSIYTEIAQEVAESCTEFYERKNKKNEQD